VEGYLEMGSTNPQLLLNLSDCYLHLSQFRKALSTYKLCLSKIPKTDSPQFYSTMAHLYKNQARAFEGAMSEARVK